MKRFRGQCNRMHETFQWSLCSNLLKRFSGLYIGTNTYVSEYMFGPTRRQALRDGCVFRFVFVA